MNHAPTDALYGQQQLPFSDIEWTWNSNIAFNDRSYRPYHAQEQDPFQIFLQLYEQSCIKAGIDPFPEWKMEHAS